MVVVKHSVALEPQHAETDHVAVNHQRIVFSMVNDLYHVEEGISKTLPGLQTFSVFSALMTFLLLKVDHFRIMVVIPISMEIQVLRSAILLNLKEYIVFFYIQQLPGFFCELLQETF